MHVRLNDYKEKMKSKWKQASLKLIISFALPAVDAAFMAEVRGPAAEVSFLFHYVIPRDQIFSASAFTQWAPKSNGKIFIIKIQYLDSLAANS